MTKKITIFIGLDEPNKISYEKCVKSIQDRNKKYDIQLYPINYNTVKEYSRKKIHTSQHNLHLLAFLHHIYVTSKV
jgi:hypothetical protein